MSKFCPNCGTQNTDDGNFCNNCGYNFKDNFQTSAQIVITRKAKAAGSAQSHDVYIYNNYIGVLKNGGKLEIPVEVGTHMLVFKSKLKKLGKDTTFNVVVNDPTEIVKLNAEFNLKGDFEISYEDNAPHFSNLHLQSNVSTQMPVTNISNPMRTTSGIRCIHCGSANLFPVSETTTKGKDFRAGDALCGALLFGPLGLLCGATGKGKQTTTTTYWLCKDCGKKFKA